MAVIAMLERKKNMNTFNISNKQDTSPDKSGHSDNNWGQLMNDLGLSQGELDYDTSEH